MGSLLTAAAMQAFAACKSPGVNSRLNDIAGEQRWAAVVNLLADSDFATVSNGAPKIVLNAAGASYRSALSDQYSLNFRALGLAQKIAGAIEVETQALHLLLM